MAQLTETSAAAAFYDELPNHDVEPLWRQLESLLPAEPKSPAVPYVWRYADLRPLLMRAGEVVTAEEAERRVLMLMNPGLRPTAAAAALVSVSWATSSLSQEGRLFCITDYSSAHWQIKSRRT